jgi:hypothetical protein
MSGTIPYVSFAKNYPKTILLSFGCGKCYRNRMVASGFGGRSVVYSVPTMNAGVTIQILSTDIL